MIKEKALEKHFEEFLSRYFNQYIGDGIITEETKGVMFEMFKEGFFFGEDYTLASLMKTEAGE